MSIAFMVFMIVPVIAPMVGSAVLLVGPWRLIFEIIAGLAVVLAGWFAARMPETLAPADRGAGPGRAGRRGHRGPRPARQHRVAAARHLG